ncbi:glutamate-5-semialdehyde dehydrogenase [Brevundimonas balnearis]|uniref:Gamma-glutamyl phosphate reductase n=1 Tax=Brevundimonas balnearis TaxID=1572858 RepID=A0ABV6R185_9CAUL
MVAMGRAARAAARPLAEAPADQRTLAIREAAVALRRRVDVVLAANAEDVLAAEGRGAPANMVDRLRLDPTRIAAIAGAMEAVAAQNDPLGAETARWSPPNGLDIARVSVPLGVLAIIFESRPNVAADAAVICLRSGNAAILRAGSDSLNSALAIHAAVAEGLRAAGLPETAVQMVATPDRDAVGHILGGLDGAIDLIIPRGGRSLVERVQKEARAPVLGHLEGVCHTYLHASADLEMARKVVLNAKMRRTSICGATETLLVDRAGAERLLPPVAGDLIAAGCELRGDVAARALVPTMTEANEADWSAEYLAPVLAVRVVDGVDQAVEHIVRHGSGHTEAIVAEDAAAAARFLNRVDSAIVMWNASTQFADGGEFGFGAEIGISTSRLHARGPVGAAQLVSYKYVVRGRGHVRP